MDLGGRAVDLKMLPEVLGGEMITAMCVEGTGLYTIANCANHDCKVCTSVLSS